MQIKLNTLRTLQTLRNAERRLIDALEGCVVLAANSFNASIPSNVHVSVQSDQFFTIGANVLTHRNFVPPNIIAMVEAGFGRHTLDDIRNHIVALEHCEDEFFETDVNHPLTRYLVFAPSHVV